MKHWLHAFRLRTLPLAASSIIVGSALGYFFSTNRIGPSYHFNFRVFLLSLTTAVLLQILSNLANDLGDHQHGTDNADRVGPQRAVQSGAITPAQMKRAMFVCGLLAFISGCALIMIALGFTVKTLIFLLLGLLAIGAAVKYTFGRNPYGYAGLGDVSVFLFFGIVGVCGTYYLHAREFLAPVSIAAVAFGLLSTGVLNVNNMRDIHNDAASGKRTLVVRMGLANAKRYHSFLVLGGIIILLFLFIAFMPSAKFLVIAWPILLLPLVHLLKVRRTKEPRALDPQLKVLAMGTFFTALLFSLGLILAV